MVSLDEASAFARDAHKQTRERYPVSTMQAFATIPGHHSSEHAHKHRGFGLPHKSPIGEARIFYISARWKFFCQESTTYYYDAFFRRIVPH